MHNSIVLRFTSAGNYASCIRRGGMGADSFEAAYIDANSGGMGNRGCECYHRLCSIFLDQGVGTVNDMTDTKNETLLSPTIFSSVLWVTQSFAAFWAPNTPRHRSKPDTKPTRRVVPDPI